MKHVHMPRNKKLSARDDGFKCDIFHKLCDNKTPIIMIFNDIKNNIFGGFTRWKLNVVDDDRVIDSTDWSSFVFILRLSMPECADQIDIPAKFGTTLCYY